MMKKMMEKIGENDGKNRVKIGEKIGFKDFGIMPTKVNCLKPFVNFYRKMRQRRENVVVC